MTFTFIRAWEVNTTAPDTTDVLVKAFIHIYTLKSTMLHHVFVAWATEAFVCSLCVDAIASAMAARL